MVFKKLSMETLQMNQVKNPKPHRQSKMEKMIQ